MYFIDRLTRERCGNEKEIIFQKCYIFERLYSIAMQNFLLSKSFPRTRKKRDQDKPVLEGTFLERGIFHRKCHASFTTPSAVIIFAQTNSENMEIRIRPCRATVNNCILAPAHATLGNGAKSAYRAFFPLTNPLFDSIVELINMPFDKTC